MTELPPCFKPTLECRMILQRVEAGYDVQHQGIVPELCRVGFIKPVGPSAGSGYALTDLGREALAR